MNIRRISPGCRSPRPSTHAHRQGVVLLVVLSLLSIFVVVCTTFLLVASHYNRAAQSHAREELRRDPPQKLLDAAFNQLLRGTRDPRSAIRGHDLLGDKYGFDGFSALVQTVQTSTLPEVRIVVSESTMKWIYMDQLGTNVSLDEDTVDHWAGCLASFVSGALRNSTGRIRASFVDVAANTATFWIVMDGSVTASGTLPSPGDRIVVNGRPFNGPGFAYNVQTEKLNAAALQPDWTGVPMDAPSGSPSFREYVYGTDANNPPAGPVRTSGPDESYDAPDFHNMALAAIIPDPSNPTEIGFIIPSFHRPELWSHHEAALGAPDPRATLRPMPAAMATTPLQYNKSLTTTGFPVKTSAELGTGATFGPLLWDVDNDGDGVRDSIWVDLGFPASADENGRLYRPLFAFLCLDMDGRLNLNYHGNRTHLAQTGYVPGQQPPLMPGILARNASIGPVPMGKGWGPAEINPFFVFWNRNTGTTDVAKAEYATALLLHGYLNPSSPQSLIPGRYGFPGSGIGPGGAPSPGVEGADALSYIKFRGYPTDYFNPSTVNTSFSTPMDLRGELAFGLDPRGSLVTEVPADTGAADHVSDNPYEVSTRAPRGSFETNAAMPKDQLFGINELERLLRFNDWDANQIESRLQLLYHPSRQAELDTNGDTVPDANVPLDFSIAAPVNRRALTTESWDSPVPSVLMRSTGPTTQGYFQQSLVAELYRRLDLTGKPGTTKNAEIVKMLSPELRRGLRLDLNAPFGDGLDDDGDGIVDEPGEPALIDASADLQDNNSNGIVDELGETMVVDSLVARRNLARSLYVLAMLLRNDTATVSVDANGDGTVNALDTSFYLAQWAINVVDFRDPDSIMTQFEFDLNPGNGWDVDNDPLTVDVDGSGVPVADRAVVWGSERPELLITETFAFHDRQTEDLDTDNKTDDTTDPDEDFDQRFPPQGGLFIELYNAWAGNDDRKPAELYAGSVGMRLDAQAPDGSPVWRLLIAEFGSNSPNQIPHPTDVAAADEERYVFFVPRTLLPSSLQNRSDVFASRTSIAPLLPSRYAVIGTGRVQEGSQFITPLGQPTVVPPTQPHMAARHIALGPNTNPSADQVRVRNDGETGGTVPPAAAAPPDNPSDRQPAIAIVAEDNLGNPLTVSEPIGGYMLGGNPLQLDALGQIIGGPIDQPLDATRSEEKFFFQNDPATNPAFRVVYLQRLANPNANFHVDGNPYISVDASQIFLNSFNGRIADQQLEVAAQGTTADNKVVFTEPPKFRTVQRGDYLRGPAVQPSSTDKARQLWRRFSLTNMVVYDDSPTEATPANNFKWYLQDTLGYLSEEFGPAFSSSNPPPHPLYLGAPDSNVGQPFPWLMWNNRPYVNQVELLNVPRSSAYDLFDDFYVHDTFQPDDAYSNDPAEATFGHLAQLLSAEGTSPAMHLYRLMDYVGVPTPFLGAETYVAPNAMSNYAKTSMPTYREPGRVNLNTMYDFRVWESVLNLFPGPNHDQLIDSIRGYPHASGGLVTPGKQLASDPSYPTIFGNPFRGPHSGTLVPVAEMERNDVDATLMRSTKVGVGSNAFAPDQHPLFADDAWLPKDAHNHSDRNSYFHYQTLQRLGSLTTTRSNVYAVWITVGYFEVDPTTGFLGQELGTDTGLIQRHRAFYIVDRSIPVAYEPGENHNVDKAVLLRRFIE